MARRRKVAEREVQQAVQQRRAARRAPLDALLVEEGEVAHELDQFVEARAAGPRRRVVGREQPLEERVAEVQQLGPQLVRREDRRV